MDGPPAWGLNIGPITLTLTNQHVTEHDGRLRTGLNLAQDTHTWQAIVNKGIIL